MFRSRREWRSNNCAGATRRNQSDVLAPKPTSTRLFVTGTSFWQIYRTYCWTRHTFNISGKPRTRLPHTRGTDPINNRHSTSIGSPVKGDKWVMDRTLPDMITNEWVYDRCSAPGYMNSRAYSTPSHDRRLFPPWAGLASVSLIGSWSPVTSAPSRGPQA